MSTQANTVFRSVADARRREVLTHLRETEANPASLDDLVASLVGQETHRRDSDREMVRLDLYHYQLPMLHDIGVIDFDSRTETVWYRGHSQIEEVLDATTQLTTDADGE